MTTMWTFRRLLLAGTMLGLTVVIPLGVTAAIVEGLSDSAVAALKNPPEKFEGKVREEIGSAWGKVAEKVLGEALKGPDAVIVTKVWLGKLGEKPFIQLLARGRTEDRKDRVVVEIFRGAGKEGIEQRYGKWFTPVTVGEQSIKKEDFAGDRAALSTLTEDGSEALYWQKDDIFIDVRRPKEVKPLADAVHKAAQKHGLYVFPEKPKVEEPMKPAIVAPPPVATVDSSITCKAGDVCREKKTGLPLRILPRPFSNVYASAEGEKVAMANVPAFHPLYVFQLQGVDASKKEGWYRVGPTVQGKPIGWMKAKDVLEWRQALIVAYTHHGTGEEARQRVLMFEDLAQLEELAEASDAGPRAVKLYQQLRKKDEDVPQGIVSKETEEFVDITQKFYMMPMVASKTVDLGGEEAKYLQVAAAVLGARGEDNLKDKTVRDRLTTKPVLKQERKKVLGLDVVFVMDTTASMQPFMDRTKDALKNLAQSFANTYKDDPELRDKIRFGLVGYRDNAKIMPALDFTTKNFTPELVGADDLVRMLETDATATIVGSRDHPEEVFAGVKEALDATQWRDNTLKIMILVGDASSHEGEHEQKTTDLDALALRQLAGDRQIHIMAIHLKDPRYKDDHPIAARQFEALTRVEGDQGSTGLVAVDLSEEGAFAEQVRPLARSVAARLNAVRKGDPTRGSSTGANGTGGASGGPLEVLTVRADTPDSTTTKTVLESGKGYIIEASGEFSAWGGEPHGVDPVWCYRPGKCDDMKFWDHLKINGKGLAAIAGGKEALPYNSQHTYRIRYQGEGKPLEMWIKDAKQGSHKNNTGGFRVKVFEAKAKPRSVQVFKKLFDAALVEYLGKETNPPKDIVAWVLDRDLTDPGVRSLEVRVLVNREQLSDLLVALDTVIKGLNNAEMTQRQFFDALQAVAAQAEKDPERIAKAQKLRDAGLLPAFVESLPYKSEILELSDAEFGGMTAEQKSGLEQRLKAKLAQYRKVNEQVDGWVKLNEQDEGTKMVYPLQLDALP